MSSVASQNKKRYGESVPSVVRTDETDSMCSSLAAEQSTKVTRVRTTHPASSTRSNRSLPAVEEQNQIHDDGDHDDKNNNRLYTVVGGVALLAVVGAVVYFLTAGSSTTATESPTSSPSFAPPATTVSTGPTRGPSASPVAPASTVSVMQSLVPIASVANTVSCEKSDPEFDGVSCVVGGYPDEGFWTALTGCPMGVIEIDQSFDLCDGCFVFKGDFENQQDRCNSCNPCNNNDIGYDCSNTAIGICSEYDCETGLCRGSTDSPTTSPTVAPTGAPTFSEGISTAIGDAQLGDNSTGAEDVGINTVEINANITLACEASDPESDGVICLVQGYPIVGYSTVFDGCPVGTEETQSFFFCDFCFVFHGDFDDEDFCNSCTLCGDHDVGFDCTNIASGGCAEYDCGPGLCVSTDAPTFLPTTEPSIAPTTQSPTASPSSGLVPTIQSLSLFPTGADDVFSVNYEESDPESDGVVCLVEGYPTDGFATALAGCPVGTEVGGFFDQCDFCFVFQGDIEENDTCNSCNTCINSNGDPDVGYDCTNTATGNCAEYDCENAMCVSTASPTSSPISIAPSTFSPSSGPTL